MERTTTDAVIERRERNQVGYCTFTKNEIGITFCPSVEHDSETACLVRCNQCMSMGYAWYGDEICPKCGEYGCLMDLDEVQECF